MAVLTHKSQSAIKRAFSLAIILFFQIIIIYFLIIVLLTCLILKPKFLAKKEIYFIYGTKFLSQNNKFNNEITFNI